MGISVLNKCSGAYGILALFTGHPLGFIQWVAYIWSIFTLIVYAQGLFQVHKPSLLTYCQIFITFSVDTVLTCLFTLFFSSQWFNEEDSSLQKVDTKTDIYGQGASESYEYFFTMLITLIALASRMYFNFILASFTQQLFFHPGYMVDQDDVLQDLKNKSKFKQVWIKSKKSCYRISKHILA